MIKLVKEEKTMVEPVPVQIKTEEPQPKEIDAKIAAVACEEAVNNLMQQAWDFISNINSVIATLELNYKEDAIKKDVIEILNAIIDDNTINIGMIQKVINLMNIKKVELLDAGEQKAENILTKAVDSE